MHGNKSFKNPVSISKTQNCLLIIKKSILSPTRIKKYECGYFMSEDLIISCCECDSSMGQKGSSGEVYFSRASVHLPQSHS